jgi:hypothetical protein
MLREPHEVFRATQEQKQREAGQGGVALLERIDPAEALKLSKLTHPAELGHTAIHLEQVATQPQHVEVHVHDEPVLAEAVSSEVVEPSEDVIPADVVAEVASKVSRKEFVAQQEDIFGANDNVETETVPEGELTYAQYLAMRPAAQEGDTYRTNGQVRDAVSGNFSKKADHEAKVENYKPDVYYKELSKSSLADMVYDEAAAENEVKNRDYETLIRDNKEGELLVRKDPRLRGLLSVGEDLLALHNSTARGIEFEETVKPDLEAKQAIFDTLYKVYADSDIDERALWYIDDKTSARVEDPDFIPIEGSAYLEGDKVIVIDFVETDDGQKAYTVEKQDGTVTAVTAEEVSFKREFEPVVKVEAAEQPEVSEVVEADTQENVEVTEANDEKNEEKQSRFERAKKWFGKEGRKWQEFSGITYVGKAWGDALNAPGKWMSRHLSKDMLTDDIEAQKNKNRRNKLLGAGAVLVVGLVARQLDIHTDVFNALDFNLFPDNGPNPVDLSSGYGGDTPHLETGIPEGSEPQIVPKLPEGANVAPIDSSVYNIPESGTGLNLFDKAGLSSDKWYENAQTLASKFPSDFYSEGGDVRLVHSGQLSSAAQQYIESLK